MAQLRYHPFQFRENPRPFSLSSLRAANVFLGVLPEEQDVRRGLLGNSLESKRIGETVRYDVTGQGACPIRPYATKEAVDVQRELLNQEFVAMYLTDMDRRVDIANWHLHINRDEATGTDRSEVSAQDEHVYVLPAEITDRDMLRSGNWAIWNALKYHDFDGINSDYLLWSRLESMVAFFQVASQSGENVGEEAEATDGVPLDDPTLQAVRRNVRRRRP